MQTAGYGSGTPSTSPAGSADLPWSVDTLPLDHIDHALVRDDEDLFFVLAGASFVESGSDLYTHNLVVYFGQSPVAEWLARHWEQEELQHGRALRAYVERVWPEFDWNRAYSRFLAEYSTYCDLEQLEPTPALELAARCVVETATATLYRSLQDYAREPVLKELAGRIRSDEVRHYKNFHRFFNQYNVNECNGRWKVLEALARRVAEVRREDADCALRHVFEWRYPGRSTDSPEFRRISALARGLVMRNASAEMMVKMLLKPLALPPRLQTCVQMPLARAMQRYLASR